MNVSSFPARWRAFYELQRLQARRFGTQDADDAEHAATLALSEDRPASNAKYLAHDALRDARRIRNRRRPLVPFSTLSAIAADDGEVNGEEGIDFHVDRFGRCADEPDQLAIAYDLEATLRQRLAKSANAGECLDGLLCGEPEMTTARRLGLPRYRVSALRALIRQITLQINGLGVGA